MKIERRLKSKSASKMSFGKSPSSSGGFSKYKGDYKSSYSKDSPSHVPSKSASGSASKPTMGVPPKNTPSREIKCYK